jgi:hypothetical protein
VTAVLDARVVSTSRAESFFYNILIALEGQLCLSKAHRIGSLIGSADAPAIFEVIFMADNVTQSIRRTDACSVSKTQLLRFFEAKFQQADRNQDGQLDIAELSSFLRSVTHPDLRALRSWDRYN